MRAAVRFLAAVAADVRTARALAVAALLAGLAGAAGARAQEDFSAGLFAQARKLPLVTQSLDVKVRGGDAELHLVQVFANDGPDVAQADYRLPLPQKASVVGFGFWREGRFLEAKLQEKREAEARHQAAASAGRATGLAKTEGAVHSFSVYPVAAGALQKVEVTLRVPVVVEAGTSHVRLPIDAFLGGAEPSSTVLVDLESLQPLDAVGAEGAAPRVLARDARRARIALASERPVDVWWREKGPPLLVHAETVPLGDGTFGTEVQVRLNRAPGAAALTSQSHLLIDASFSMRSRAALVEQAAARFLSRAKGERRVHLVAERALSLPAGAPAREVAEALQERRAGHSGSWAQIEREARRLGCFGPGVRCAALVDGQLEGLSEATKAELPVLVLADPYEYAHAEAVLEGHPLVHKVSADPAGQLLASVDELVLPVLNVTAVAQGDAVLELPGRQDRRVAEGGMLRLAGVSVRTPSDDGVSAGANGVTTAPGRVQVAFLLEGETLERSVEAVVLDAKSEEGARVRRAVYERRIEAWMQEYRKAPDPALRQRIVEASVRENIPTSFTALQVDAPLPAPEAVAFYGSAAPEPAEWAAILLLVGLGFVAVRRRGGVRFPGAGA